MAVTNNSVNNSSAPFAVTAGDLTVTNLTATYGGVVLSGTTGVISHVENAAADGQVLISKADGSNPVWATLTAGAGIDITEGANQITIAITSGTASWTPEATAFDIVSDCGYITTGGALVVATLPATAVIGDTFEITNTTSFGWSVAQNALQYINFGNLSSTIGITGSLSSTAIGDSLRVVCIVTDVGFQVLSSVGNITVV